MDQIDRVLDQIADQSERTEVAADAIKGEYHRAGKIYPAWIGQSHTANIIEQLSHRSTK